MLFLLKNHRKAIFSSPTCKSAFFKYKDISKIYNELDQYLSIYVYDKIWSNLPKNERIFLKCFKNASITTKEILKEVPYNENSIYVYRDRLIKRGLIASTSLGTISLTLPRFENFISKQVD